MLVIWNLLIYFNVFFSPYFTCSVNNTSNSSPTIRSNPTMRSRSISCVQVANANQERSNSLTLTTPLKNIIKRASQVSDHSSSTSSSQRNSAEQLIELNEQVNAHLLKSLKIFCLKQLPIPMIEDDS